MFSRNQIPIQVLKVISNIKCMSSEAGPPAPRKIAETPEVDGSETLVGYDVDVLCWSVHVSQLISLNRYEN